VGVKLPNAQKIIQMTMISQNRNPIVMTRTLLCYRGHVVVLLAHQVVGMQVTVVHHLLLL
jgi:hypothetical protein